MTPREKIEAKRDDVASLCVELTIPALTVYYTADGATWDDVVFVADIDVSRLKGYARRLFGLEHGLLRIFHHRIEVTEVEMFSQTASSPVAMTPVELLRAS